MRVLRYRPATACKPLAARAMPLQQEECSAAPDGARGLQEHAVQADRCRAATAARSKPLESKAESVARLGGDSAVRVSPARCGSLQRKGCIRQHAQRCPASSAPRQLLGPRGARGGGRLAFTGLQSTAVLMRPAVLMVIYVVCQGTHRRGTRCHTTPSAAISFLIPPPARRLITSCWRRCALHTALSQSASSHAVHLRLPAGIQCSYCSVPFARARKRR